MYLYQSLSAAKQDIGSVELFYCIERLILWGREAKKKIMKYG